MFCPWGQREKAAEKEKLKKQKNFFSLSCVSFLKFFWTPFLARKGVNYNDYLCYQNN